jgi:hypothetical protein
MNEAKPLYPGNVYDNPLKGYNTLYNEVNIVRKELERLYKHAQEDYAIDKHTLHRENALGRVCAYETAISLIKDIFVRLE